MRGSPASAEYANPAIAAPTIGATQNSQSCEIAHPPTNTAGPVLLAGLTDVFLYVADVDGLFAELSARGAICQLPPTNQTWGNREMGIRDPDGNVLVFATPIMKKEG